MRTGNSIILFGIHDINNKVEDHKIVDEVLWTIGCEHRIANKNNIIRLGNKKPGRNRLLMVCFNSETAASQVLNRSSNLVKSTFLGHIYIKRDLPRNQRPPPRNRNSRLEEAAMGAPALTPVADRHRSSLPPPPPAPAPTVIRETGCELSDINSDSDFDGYITVEEPITEDVREGGVHNVHNEMVSISTVAEVHRVMSPSAEVGGSPHRSHGGPAAPTHRITKSRLDTVINLEEITIERVNIEPGFDDCGVNNVELHPGNEQEQIELIPG